ncbi:hypothetical protein BC831DRAFT_471700, partial [Entophlyctis helioformis]
NVLYSFTLHSRSTRHSSTFVLTLLKTALGSAAIQPDGSPMTARWQPDGSLIWPGSPMASPSSRNPAFTTRRPFSNQTRRQVPSRSTLQSDLGIPTENALQGEEDVTGMGGASFGSRGCCCFWCCWWLSGQGRVLQCLALPCFCFGWSCPCSRDGGAGAGVRLGGTLRAL